MLAGRVLPWIQRILRCVIVKVLQLLAAVLRQLLSVVLDLVPGLGQVIALRVKLGYDIQLVLELGVVLRDVSINVGDHSLHGGN